jgi:glycosyltransferase involved in cell wall biosynthesis
VSVESVVAIGPASGGVHDMLLGTVRALRIAGYEVQVLVPAGPGSAFGAAARLLWRERESLRRAAILHVELGSNDHAVFWLGVLLARLGYWPVTVVHDPDQVAHAPGAALIAHRGRWRKRLAYRVLSPLLDRWAVRCLLSRSRAVVVLGTSGLALARSRTTRPVHVAPHGALLPRETLRPPSEGGYILFAGYLGPSKGLDTLLEAWSQVGDIGLELWIAGGGGPDAARWLAELRSQFPPAARASRYLGEQDDASFQRLIERAAVVVLPYRRSSPASGILVRAMSAGRCIIATRVPAVIENIEDEKEGTLVPVGDAESLSKALSRTAADPALRDRLGEGALERSKTAFGWEQFVSGLVRAYGERPT